METLRQVRDSRPCLARRQAGTGLLHLWIVERGVLAVRSVSGFAAPEMPGRNGFSIPLMGQQFDEPGFVFDFLVENPRGHVVGSGIFSKRDIADGDPTANCAT